LESEIELKSPATALLGSETPWPAKEAIYAIARIGTIVAAYSSLRNLDR